MSLFTLQTSDQQQYGPVELETLRAWAREGRIERNNVIYDHTRLKWIDACKLPQIMEFFPTTTATPVSVAAANPKESFSKTVVEDPLARIEKQVAAQIEISKAAAIANLPSDKTPGSSGKLKLHKDVTGTVTASDNLRKMTGVTKPPTILDRISRIFLSPFAKKKGVMSKKNSKN